MNKPTEEEIEQALADIRAKFGEELSEEMAEDILDNANRARTMAFKIYEPMLELDPVVRGLCISTMAAIYMMELKEVDRNVALKFMFDAIQHDMETMQPILDKIKDEV